MRAPCGDDIIVDDDGHLVIRAAFPIDGLEASRYRRPVLVYEHTRWTLVEVAPEQSAPRVVYRFTPEDPNLYAPAGDVVVYDGARHLVRRHERRRAALAWILWIPTVPLLPLLGLLPRAAKEKLVALGVNPDSATTVSLYVEYLLVLACVAVYFLLGGPFSLAGFAMGAFTLFLLADVAYRITANAQGEAPGMFSVAGEIARFVRAMRAPPLLLPPDEARRDEPDDRDARGGDPG